MYFHNRADAGRNLAKRLLKYQSKNSVVVALSPGAVLVGTQIAIRLHCNMMMLVTENIMIPGEPTPLAAMSDSNVLTYNPEYSSGEIEEFNMEYFNVIEQQRLENVHALHRLVDADGKVQRELLKHHVIIIVADGLPTGLSLDVTADFLKPIKTGRIIVACPVASQAAVDRMHLLSDEFHVLNVPNNYLSTEHYYDDNTIPDGDSLMKVIRNIALAWDRNDPTFSK